MNVVKTKYGPIRGIIIRTEPLVEAYLGVPYASPPVGSLRFMPPVTPSSWKHTRLADHFSAVCPQSVPIPANGPEALLEVPRGRLAQLRRLLPLLTNQSEDCLYLNLYVPRAINPGFPSPPSPTDINHDAHINFGSIQSDGININLNNNNNDNITQIHNSETTFTNGGYTNLNDNKIKRKLLPTIVYIHGESYEWNSGNPYDGSVLAAHGNVIVVTINFRLGILGFLKTGGKGSAQGNFGLMDLVAGLHWLHENLPRFGGNPNEITLMGHDTGAALANILIVSPVASDLIHRAILLSGSALSPWAIHKDPLFVKRRVAEQTGCHGDLLIDDLAPCLRTKTIEELLNVTIDTPRFLPSFAPFVDGTVISNPSSTSNISPLILPTGSAIASTSGIEFADFPTRELIFGLTSIESYLDLSAQDLEFGFNETRRDRILRTYVRNVYYYHLNEIFAALKNEYTDWERPVRNPLASRDASLELLSDGHTAAPLIRLGYLHSLRGGKTYFLHFRHHSGETDFPQRSGSVRGEDVPFCLGLPVSSLFPYNYTKQDIKISRMLVRYLSNFAKNGNPNDNPVSNDISRLTNNNKLNLLDSSSLTLAENLNQNKQLTTSKINPFYNNIISLSSDIITGAETETESSITTTSSSSSTSSPPAAPQISQYTEPSLSATVKHFQTMSLTRNIKNENNKYFNNDNNNNNNNPRLKRIKKYENILQKKDKFIYNNKDNAHISLIPISSTTSPMPMPLTLSSLVTMKNYPYSDVASKIDATSLNKLKKSKRSLFTFNNYNNNNINNNNKLLKILKRNKRNINFKHFNNQNKKRKKFLIYDKNNNNNNNQQLAAGSATAELQSTIQPTTILNNNYYNKKNYDLNNQLNYSKIFYKIYDIEIKNNKQNNYNNNNNRNINRFDRSLNYNRYTKSIKPIRHDMQNDRGRIGKKLNNNNNNNDEDDDENDDENDYDDDDDDDDIDDDNIDDSEDDFKREIGNKNLNENDDENLTNENDDTIENKSDDRDENNSEKYDRFGDTINNLRLPFWDTYDAINQLYLDLGNKVEIRNHYRGHKLSMWLSLIPQLHSPGDLNDLPMRHHHFSEDSAQYYDGIIRPQITTKPIFIKPTSVPIQSSTIPTPYIEPTTIISNVPSATTECLHNITVVPTIAATRPQNQQQNNSINLIKNPSTINNNNNLKDQNLLLRLANGQFQSYTTALIVTISVGCFLLFLNILIFAGIYYQREKRLNDAKKKEELREAELLSNSPNLEKYGCSSTAVIGSSGCKIKSNRKSSIHSLTTFNSNTNFGEYSCYDEKLVVQFKEKNPLNDLTLNEIKCSSSLSPNNALNLSSSRNQSSSKEQLNNSTNGLVIYLPSYNSNTTTFHKQHSSVSDTTFNNSDLEKKSTAVPNSSSITNLDKTSSFCQTPKSFPKHIHHQHHLHHHQLYVHSSTDSSNSINNLNCGTSATATGTTATVATATTTTINDNLHCNQSTQSDDLNLDDKINKIDLKNSISDDKSILVVVNNNNNSNNSNNSGNNSGTSIRNSKILINKIKNNNTNIDDNELSPDIPEPPPPPKSQIPFHGGILRTNNNPPVTPNSNKKRVQIQEISV